MKAFIHKTLIKQAHLVIGLMLCQLSQSEIGRHHTCHVAFYRINDPVISYPAFNIIILLPLVETTTIGYNKIQPFFIILLKLQNLKLRYDLFEIKFINIKQSILSQSATQT